MSNLIIDICSGQGRFPGTNVISIDFDRKTKPTILADIRHLPLKPNLKPKLLHASPPCTFISKARMWAIGWNPLGLAETFRLYACCFEIADYLKPETFTFESPQAIERYLGYKTKFRYDKADNKGCTTNIYCSKKGLKRAIIPKEVRGKILDLAFGEKTER